MCIISNINQISMQEKLFNEHIIKQFFSNIAFKDRYTTLKELVLLGINSVNRRIDNQDYNLSNKENRTELSHLSKNQLIKQIQNMKSKIQHLASVVQRQEYIASPSKIQTAKFKQNNIKPIEVMDKQGYNFFNSININHCGPAANSSEKNKITAKVTEVIPDCHNQYSGKKRATVSQSNKKMSRHHLDDSQVRRALINPYAVENQNKISKGLKKDKQFVHQQEVDKEQLKILKISHQNQQREQVLGRSKRSKTSYNKLKAESKIKMLVEKDKLRHKEANDYLDLHKYQYSSQQDQHQQEQDDYANQKVIEQQQQSSNFNETYQNKNQQSFDSAKQKEFQQSQRATIDAKKCKSKKRNKEPVSKINQSSQSFSNYIKQPNTKQENNIRSSQKNNQECYDHSDQISESSSFSKFSLNSQRQVGKISGRRN